MNIKCIYKKISMLSKQSYFCMASYISVVLMDKVPDELWTDVHDIVQKTGIKTMPRKRNAEKQNGCLRRHYK